MNIPNYFYRDTENREIGPLPLPALAQLRKAGVLSDNTLVRAEDAFEWVECRTIIAAGDTSSGSANVSPGSASPRVPATLGKAALLGRHSWSVYAVALLCFLLPFIEVSCQHKPLVSLNGYQFAFGADVAQTNPVTGAAETRHLGAETTATIALALACLGLLTAFIKKPESNAIGAAAGVGAVIALLMLKAKAESQIAQQGQGIIEITFKEGYWLTFVLLIAGSVIQVRAIAKAWSDGWRIRREHGILLGMVLLVVGIFYLGPIGYDTLTNRIPPALLVLKQLSSSQPPWVNTFDITTSDLGFAPGEGVLSGTVNIMLARRSAVFIADDIAHRAESSGFDSNTFAAAVSSRNNLPSDLQPDLPRESPRLFSISKPKGENIPILVKFNAFKEALRWDLNSRLAAWTHQRGWYVARFTWPESPDALQPLPTVISPDGAIWGEESGKSALTKYISDRQSFVKAIAAADSKAVERRRDEVTQNAVRRFAVGEFLKPLAVPDAFVVSEVRISKIETPGIGSDNTDSIYEVTAQIRQSLDLFKESSVQPSGWDELQPHSEFQRKVEIARRLFPSLGPPDFSPFKIYKLNSRSGVIIPARLTLNVKIAMDNPETPVVTVQARDFANIPSGIPRRDLDMNAILVPDQPGAISVSQCKDKISGFCKEVDSALTERFFSALAVAPGDGARVLPVAIRFFHADKDQIWQALVKETQHKGLFSEGGNVNLERGTIFGTVKRVGNLNHYFGDGSDAAHPDNNLNGFPCVLVTDCGDSICVQVLTLVFIDSNWNSPNGMQNSRTYKADGETSLRNSTELLDSIAAHRN